MVEGGRVGDRAGVRASERVGWLNGGGGRDEQRCVRACGRE